MAAPTESAVQHIELSIDSRLEDVALLGGAVGGLAAVLGFDEAERYHLEEFCTVEAASNSVRHAYGGEPGHPVRVRVDAAAGRLELRVADRGLPVPEEHRAPPSLAVDADDAVDPLAIPEGGRGIFLMHTLMDEVSFGLDDGWNVVTLCKRRPGG